MALSYPSQDYHLTRSHIILTFLRPTRSDLLRPRRQSPSELQHLKQSYRCDTRKDARRELVVRGAVTLGASQRAGGSCRRRLTLNLDEDMTRKLVISSSRPVVQSTCLVVHKSVHGYYPSVLLARVSAVAIRDHLFLSSSSSASRRRRARLCILTSRHIRRLLQEGPPKPQGLFYREDVGSNRS